MINVSLKILENGKGLPLPSYATLGSSGLDLYAAIENQMVIPPTKRLIVPTGCAIALPVNYEAQIRSRSGLAAKYGVIVLNSPGTIDADYRGEIKICLINLGENNFVIQRGDRIAQMIISLYTTVKWKLTQTLEATDRGQGGFGSTGQ